MKNKKLSKKSNSTKTQLRKCKYQLSIGIIVKNEDRILRRCLEALASLREAISCEIIITDTGSTDNTIEIAKEFADKFIEFEWCDDFSKARNTTVEASEGSWYMFLDADEVFDESVLKIADFINSKTKNYYNGASFIIRNYEDNNMINSSDFVGLRLFNFSVSKKYFTGRVHEEIKLSMPVFEIVAVANHDGYTPDIRLKKIDRNSAYMKKELEENPHDIKTIYHQVYECSDINEKIELAKKGIEIAKETNQLTNPFLECIYIELCRGYVIKKEYDMVDECVEEYFEIQKNVTLPKLEILYILSVSNSARGKNQKAIDNFIEYQKSYIILEKTPDYISDKMRVYNFYNQEIFIKSYLSLATLYLRLDEKAKAKDVLLQSKAFEYEKISGQLPHLDTYLALATKIEEPSLLVNAYKAICKKISNNKRLEIMKAINIHIRSLKIEKQKEILICFQEQTIADGFIGLNHLRFYDYDISLCSEEIIKAISNDENIYSTFIFTDALYATIKSGIDGFGFFKKCSYSQLIKLANKIFDEHNDFSNLIMQILPLKQSVENQSIKVTMFYSYLAFLFIVKLTNKSSDDGKLEKIDDDQQKIFTLFVDMTYGYINQIYKEEFLTEEFVGFLTPEQGFAFYAHEALIKKSYSEIEYVKGLKMAVKYCSNMSNYVLSLIADVEKKLKESDDNNNEFKLLGIKIKQSIRDLIKIGDKETAHEILRQYTQINPSDDELVTLLNEVLVISSSSI